MSALIKFIRINTFKTICKGNNNYKNIIKFAQKLTKSEQYMEQQRTTPEFITELKPNELFVFGSTLTFLVTRIGCGIAGFTDEEISPLFEKAHDVDNIVLPKGW